jgi:hypothetical protein
LPGGAVRFSLQRAVQAIDNGRPLRTPGLLIG